MCGKHFGNTYFDTDIYSITNPTRQFFERFIKMFFFFSFIWDKKGDKIKRNVIINSKMKTAYKCHISPLFAQH